MRAAWGTATASAPKYMCVHACTHTLEEISLDTDHKPLLLMFSQIFFLWALCTLLQIRTNPHKQVWFVADCRATLQAERELRPPVSREVCRSVCVCVRVFVCRAGRADQLCAHRGDV